MTRQEKREATRAALLESAAKVVARRGLDAASVEEIAEEAGFSRGAFYSNFDTKEALFLHLIEERTAEYLREIAGAFEKGDTAEERLANGGRFIESLVTQDHEWCLLYMEFWGTAARDPELRRRFADQYATWRIGITAMIDSQAEELGLSIETPVEELASALIALFDGFVLQKLIDPDALPDGYFSRLLLRFFTQIGALESSATPES